MCSSDLAEAKAEFVGGTATPMPTPVVKSPFGTLLGFSGSNKMAAVEKAVVQTPTTDTHKVSATDQHDAVNAKLATLVWGGSSKQFGVSDRGALVHTAAEKAEPSLAKFAELFQTKAAALSAKVVVDTGGDRLNVFVKQPAPQNDDDLDAHHMADVRDTATLRHFVDAVHDHAMVNTAPAADADMWHHFVDGGHALFA